MEKIDFELFDSDGYPSEKALEFLENYANFNDVHEIIEMVERLWWMPDWGLRKKKPFTEIYANGKFRQYTYHMSTAGWSGNEDLIYSLKKNFIFWTYWWKTERGGHYTFRFPYKKLKDEK